MIRHVGKTYNRTGAAVIQELESSRPRGLAIITLKPENPANQEISDDRYVLYNFKTADPENREIAESRFLLRNRRGPMIQHVDTYNFGNPLFTTGVCVGKRPWVSGDLGMGDFLYNFKSAKSAKSGNSGRLGFDL